MTALTQIRRPGPWRWLMCAVTALVAVATSSSTGAGPSALPPSRPSPASGQVTALWRDLAADLAPTLTASRGLLLGSRDPSGPSCVRPGTVCPLASASGGPGTRKTYLWLHSLPKRQSPSADFTWQQTVLRPGVEELQTRNRKVLPDVVRLAGRARQLARALRDQAAVDAFSATSSISVRDWPTFCAAEVERAGARGDLASARLWSGELAAATFALADLHCWLDYLVENELAVLEFQARCRNLFLSCDPLYAGTYSPHRDVGRFPAGRAVYTAIDNYLEVERQAEWLFRVPRDFLTVRLDGAFTVKRDGVSEVPAAVWMPPHLRGIFVRLREHLSAANQEVWDEAAASRFDRSYLANMLFRVSHAGALDQLAVVLERFSAAHAKADRHKLMDVVFYRGGDPSGGVEWGDRFAARLMDAAGVMAGTDEQALLRSQHFTRATLGTWKNYGWSGTLREVLSDGKLDCINAADMIGALFRNAGHAGYYNIRWCAGLAGHTVAAAEVATAGGSAVVIVDGLQPPQTSAESWPYAYTRGTAWPEGYTGRQADVHAVELYSRGLDNYVWVEGYIVRGPNAGILVRASVPYLPNRLRSSTLRVDRGSRPDAAPSGAG